MNKLLSWNIIEIPPDFAHVVNVERGQMNYISNTVLFKSV